MREDLCKQKFNEWVEQKAKTQQTQEEQQAAETSQQKTKDLNREPQLPEEWVKKYDRKIQKKRRAQIQEQMRQKKAQIEETRRRADSEQGWISWVQRKEIEKMQKMVDAQRTMTMHSQS